VADSPNGNGLRDSGSSPRFRNALLAIQILLIGGFPLGAWIAELTGHWHLTPLWESVYRYDIVIPTMVGLGLVRVHDAVVIWQAVKGQPAPSTGGNQP
jgi:hypothetical protein